VCGRKESAGFGQLCMPVFFAGDEKFMNEQEKWEFSTQRFK
jgi:hypothetical protein